MSLSKLQKLAGQAIVQVFETGSVRGDYGKVTLLPGDTGHLTYGKAQTTLGSGNLYFLIKDYVDASGAEFGRALKPFLPRLERKDTRLDRHRRFKRLLRNAGDDKVMREVQDIFFDRVYWEPTLRSAEYIGATTALGTAIIYDSRIHGSWHAVRDQVIAQYGALSALGEEPWMAKYVAHRRNWLANHSNPGLHPTVYRMDELKHLMNNGRWDLSVPFMVRGLSISDLSLELTGGRPPRASAEGPPRRLLKLDDPQFVGEDVREIQNALKAKGYTLTADGIFGSGTDTAIRDVQAAAALRGDGVVGGLTREALGLAP